MNDFRCHFLPEGTVRSGLDSSIAFPVTYRIAGRFQSLIIADKSHGTGVTQVLSREEVKVLMEISTDVAIVAQTCEKSAMRSLALCDLVPEVRSPLLSYIAKYTRSYNVLITHSR